MSLLDTGPDTLTVWPEVEVIDSRRNPTREPGTDSTTVTGRLQPVSSTETATEGQQVSTLYRFIARDFPGGPWAKVVSADGRRWDVVGEPARHTGSARTRHVTVLLRARAPKDVPNG